MFSKTRPVPSKAALKVLYQLAYISSGTAVGVAALCAEERRRRSKIVQNIADNARRIRQSPRHVHSAALAAEQHELDLPCYEDRTSAAVNDTDPRNRSSESRRELLPRSSYLPSSVEKAYKRSTFEDNRMQLDSLQNQSESTAGEEVDFAESDSNGARRTRFSSLVDADILPYRRSVHSQSHTPKVAAARRDSIKSETASRQVKATSHQTESSRFYDKPDLVEPEAQATRQSSLSASSNSIAPALDEPLKHNAATSSQLDVEPCLVGTLSQLLSTGSLSEIEISFMSKIEQETFTESDVHEICYAVVKLAQRIEHQALLEFYSGLFTAVSSCGQISQGSEAMLFRDGLYILHNSLMWTTPLCSDRERASKILGSMLGITSSETVFSELDSMCQAWVRSGRLSHAIRFFTCASTAVTTPVEKLDQLADELYGYAARKDHLKSCQRLILWKAAKGYMDDTFVHQLDTLIETCDPSKRSNLLGPIVRRLENGSWPAELVPRLSAKSRAILALTYTRRKNTDPSTTDQLLVDVPDALRISVDNAVVAAQLQRTWKLTHNLDTVRTRFEEAASHTKSPECSEGEFSEIEMAMLEIYSDSSRTDLAIELLSHHDHQRYSDDRVVYLAAIVLAMKRDWEQLDHLLRNVAEREMYGVSPHTTRILNLLLSLYCQHHSASQVWKFVTRMIEELSFVPSRFTTEILLLSFVRGKALDSITGWMRYLQTHRHSFDFNAKISAMLLNRFCIDERPPHALVVDLCQDLLHRAPTLDAAAFDEVLKEAIAHDLRNLDAQDKSALKRKAEYNIAKLSRSEEELVSEDLQNPDAPELNAVESATDLSNDDSGYGSSDSAADLRVHSKIDASSSSRRSKDGADNVAWSGIDAISQRRRVERNMLFEMARQDYQKTLALYHNSVDPSGLPCSALTLDLGVQACILMNGGEVKHAVDMIKRARSAGFDIIHAAGSLLLHRIRVGDCDPSRLHAMVTHYYRESKQRGWPASNHVAVTAAMFLARKGRTLEALRLLDVLFRSNGADRRTLDIAGMTMFFKIYTVLGSWHGIDWVFKTVVREGMQIDRQFLGTLGRGCVYSSRKSPRVARLIQRWRTVFRQRRLDQRHEARVFGNKLVKCIAECYNASQQPAIDIAERQELETTLFGAPDPVHEMEVQTNYVPNGSSFKGRESLMLNDLEWSTRYRFFHRRSRFHMPQGQLASFRFTVANDRGLQYVDRGKRNATSIYDHEDYARRQ